MNRKALKTDLIVLVLLSAAVLVAIAAQGSPPSDTPAHITGVQHLYVQLTVWSDGTVDVPPPTVLDARTARRLANRLEDEEDKRRPMRRATGELPSRVQRAMDAKAARETNQANGANADTDPGRCHAIAKSTGRRCKNRATTGSLYCNIHRPAREN